MICILKNFPIIGSSQSEDLLLLVLVAFGGTFCIPGYLFSPHYIVINILLVMAI